MHPKDVGLVAYHTGSEISFYQLIHTIASHWRLLVICIVGGLSTSVLVAIFSVPVYESKVVFTDVSNSRPSQSSGLLGQLGGIASLAGIDMGALDTSIGEAQGVLRSRNLLGQFISRNDLIPVIFPEDWNDNGQTWKVDLGDRPTLWEATRKFEEEIRQVQSDPSTGLITLVVQWTDPKLAAEWANGLVSLANEIVRTRVVASAERNIGFLEAQLEKTNVVEMQAVLYDLIATETQTLMLANARPQYAFVVVDPAVPAEVPERPRELLIIFLGTALGGLVGLFAILVSESISGYRRALYTSDVRSESRQSAVHPSLAGRKKSSTVTPNARAP